MDHVAAAKADIARVGWHYLLIRGNEGQPGFVYTIGLWQSYRHPELIIFAPGQDPSRFGPALVTLANRVAAGEVFHPNVPIQGVFKDISAIAREVREDWYPSFLGTAGGVYNSYDFPAMQVFWPDAQGHYPWEAEADSELFRLQPLLDQENPIFANLGRAEIERLLKEKRSKEYFELLFDSGLQELFVPVPKGIDPLKSWRWLVGNKLTPVPKGIDLLKSWRWLVGNELTVFKVTLFGDMLLEDKNQNLHWLDIGYGELQDLGITQKTLLPAFYEVAFDCIHVRLLLDLKAAGKELRPAGLVLTEPYVYDWVTPPMLGGALTKNNVERGLLEVATDAAGQLAQQLHRRRAQAEAQRNNGPNP